MILAHQIQESMQGIFLYGLDVYFIAIDESANH